MKIYENKNNMLIFSNENQTYFVSYQTTIASYNEETRKLKINVNYWDYSQTTLKQLKYFINNYTCFKYETKKEFEKEIENNDNIEQVIIL